MALIMAENIRKVEYGALSATNFGPTSAASIKSLRVTPAIAAGIADSRMERTRVAGGTYRSFARPSTQVIHVHQATTPSTIRAASTIKGCKRNGFTTGSISEPRP